MAKSKTLIDQILDKYGENTIITDRHSSISTGSIAMDVSMGIGGVPHGRYTEIYGPESGGKTTLCLSICKNALMEGQKVLYVDVENSLHLPYAREIMGEYYDPESIIIVQPLSAEDSFEIAEAGMDAGRDLIIFDSIAAIAPTVELEEDDYEKMTIGIPSKKANLFLRKTAHKVRDNQIAVVFTNQVRANIGSYHGGFVTPIGYALKHYTSMRIYMSKGEDMKNELDENGDPIGHFINFTIKKNKLGRPYRQAETALIYKKGINTVRDVIKFGSLLGVIQSRGSYYTFNEETIGQGMAKSVETLESDPERLDKIIKMCYNVAKVEYPPLRKGNYEQKYQDG
jgi:recombination protein RecA